MIQSIDAYRKKTRKSSLIYRRASQIMPGGQSHNARFFEPYPFYATKASGKFIWDLDGNKYVDYWMGHSALILGHSPPVVVKEIEKQFKNGLLLGAPNKYAYGLAHLVNETVPCAESVRFCTTGAEATTYAVRLARAFTKRRLVVKMAGGWHGYNSSLAVGVSAPYKVPESAGLEQDERLVVLGSFNDEKKTEELFETNQQEIAAVIVEPVMGAGGVIPANKSYLEFLKKRCAGIGALLIFDEIITGFRLGIGGAQEYYGVKPDICTLGKILGGGLPASAIAGRSDILSLADVTNKSKTERCWIGGGTFSENALCMRAGIATLEFLIKNKKRIYGKISKLGERVRGSVDKAFAENGVRTKTTGIGSLFGTHFLTADQEEISSPEDVDNSDRDLERNYHFSLIATHGIYFVPGHVGSISNAHDEDDVRDLVLASGSVARTFSGRSSGKSPRQQMIPKDA